MHKNTSEKRSASCASKQEILLWHFFPVQLIPSVNTTLFFATWSHSHNRNRNPHSLHRLRLLPLQCRLHNNHNSRTRSTRRLEPEPVRLVHLRLIPTIKALVVTILNWQTFHSPYRFRCNNRSRGFTCYYCRGFSPGEDQQRWRQIGIVVSSVIRLHVFRELFLGIKILRTQRALEVQIHTFWWMTSLVKR